MLRTNKLIIGSLLAMVTFMLASDLALAGKHAPPPPPEPPPLPPVRYQIKYVKLPNNAEPDLVIPLQTGGMTNAFSMDEGNSWHVRVVGRFRVDGLQNAFLYDPTVNAKGGSGPGTIFVADCGIWKRAHVTQTGRGRAVTVGSVCWTDQFGDAPGRRVSVPDSSTRHTGAGIRVAALAEGERDYSRASEVARPRAPP